MFFKGILRPIYYRIVPKYYAELAYWKKCYHQDGCSFSNQHYEKLLLAIAKEKNQDFMRGKVIADFGCGPRGSLSWVKTSQFNIGIDVLIPQYLKHFQNSMKDHGMIYLACSETCIPLPDLSVDIIFSLNALDHVNQLPDICNELRRILKPGGEIIGSFNLYQAPSSAEPQCLSPEILDRYLLKGFKIKHRLISAIPETGYLYQPLIDEKPLPLNNSEAILWLRAEKV
ncbi:MAG TPA: class I SAM-dependent methyltransferase [Candidatus Cloacimonadota bacterium]|nr:class I SAM-dependent methyltransferase [Candidatus Cloacimonadota bacterium]